LPQTFPQSARRAHQQVRSFGAAQERVANHHLLLIGPPDIHRRFVWKRPLSAENSMLNRFSVPLLLYEWRYALPSGTGRQVWACNNIVSCALRRSNQPLAAAAPEDHRLLGRLPCLPRRLGAGWLATNGFTFQPDADTPDGKHLQQTSL